MYEFRYSNVQKEMEVYGYDEMVKTSCRGCHGGCGVYVYVKDGKIAKIQGNPDHPINHGTLCSKGLAAAQLVYSPDRLKYPLKRVGPKASGKWERISWDEALDTIAARILEYKDKFGPESVVFGYGTGRENEAVIYRIANLLGSPNTLTAGHFCYGPRISTGIITIGTNPIVDYENLPKCIMLWGNNVTTVNADEYKGEPFSVALDAGAKLIVVDPRLTRPAARADVWLQLRPGTDGALALGMLNYIINEELHDKEFCENFTFGWDEFVARVNEYPLDKVEQITWVPKEKIMEAARLFATTKPAGIQWGVAIEQQINCVDNDRLLMCIMALTGNLDKPGGQALFRTPKVVNVGQFGAHGFLTPAQSQKRLGGDRFRLSSRFAIINPKCVWDAINDEKPYPVKMLFFISSNPMMTRPNAKDVYKALENVEFMAVADFHHTPTTELADIVLPAAHWLEMDYVGDFWKRHGYIVTRRKVVQTGECRSDHEMLNDLAHRIGQGEMWWDNFEQAMDYILSPSGMNWQDLKEVDYIRGEVKYFKYLDNGFSTPTRKVELKSTILEKMGYDPIPQHREPPEGPYTTPEIYKDYPYILITGVRIPGFFHSEYQGLPWVRELSKDPLVQVHPEAAAKEGIKEGDWVVLESLRGKVRMKATLFAGMDPRILSAQHARWFPEDKDPRHGWERSNISVLLSDALEEQDPTFGASNLKTALCRIRPEDPKEAVHE